ncbi:putative AraC family transcription activator [Magnetofaba australis IT-1]|uniref:Putative AraC family transcription activator n=1 Tax=Magnetofaba australis IT-1 TaxID=1434232 RepID=A0A1Y2K2T4_9PROT|nr:putative AraC family transcription activator [Magnetofaba australis IT-1]
MNKAQTRVDLLNAVYKLTANTRFDELKVKQIAAEAGITEMTFFNYFAKKEDVLRYMMGVWALELMVLQHEQPLTGAAAIRRLFQHTAEYVQKRPRLMAHFVALLLIRDLPPQGDAIEPADRFLWHPDIPAVLNGEIPSGNEILLRHLREMPAVADPMQTLMHLASCFYGDMVLAHTADLPIDELYASSLDRILGPQGKQS